MPGLDPIVFISWAEEHARDQTEQLPVDLRDRIKKVSFTDKARGADECNIEMDNIDLALFDDPRMAEGNRIRVQWGYPHDMGPGREVTIKSVKGWSSLQIECAGSRELSFITTAKVRTWESVTAAQVAREIAGELGFRSNDSLDVEEMEGAMTYEGLAQQGETDFAFLQRIADREDYVFRVVGEVFHFHPPRLGEAPVVTLTYFDDRRGVFIGEPSLEAGTLGIPGRVTRRGHSPRDRAAVEGTASNSTDTTRDTQGEQVLVRDPVNHTWTNQSRPRSEEQSANSHAAVGHSSATTEEEAEGQARSNFRRGERTAIELSATVIGMPNLRADTIIRIEGIGQKLSGCYYIEEVTHTVGAGYQCGLKLKKNATGRVNSRRGRGGREQQLQAINRDQARLDERLESGDITQSEYDQQSRELTTRREAVMAQGPEDSAGRVNNQGSREEGELQERTYRDPETHQWVTRYERSGGSGTAGSGGGH